MAVAPSRARGLKRLVKLCRTLTNSGRAFTGAWIETGSGTTAAAAIKGRAFTGAWIETRQTATTISLAEPSRLHGRVD